MIEGIFRTSIACSNKDMLGYWKVFSMNLCVQYAVELCLSLFDCLTYYVLTKVTLSSSSSATYFSGLSSILLSVIIIATMPLSAIETIGILLGCNLTTLGVSRLMIGCAGRSINNQFVTTADAHKMMPPMV